MLPHRHHLDGQTLLLTGATGFLGRYLAEVLAARGAQLRLLVRDPSRLAFLRSAEPEIAFDAVAGEITEPDAVREAMAGVDLVVHAAAAVGFGGKRAEQRMRRVNVEGTATLVEAARHAGVSRFLHVSSIAALGRPAQQAGPLDETAAWQASPLNTAYATSKYEAELEVQRGAAEGLGVVLANPALIFGVGRRGENTMQIAERAARGKAPLAPAGGTTVVDVRDVAEGCARVLERGEPGERYVLAGDQLAWREILGTLAEAFGAEAPRGIMPPRLALTLAGLAETAARLTRREAAFTREAARLSSRTQHYASARAQSELGMSFRSFEETAAWMARTIRWDESDA